jgi:PRC-barrel domain protein
MGDPVSWLLIEPGWRVVDENGEDVGRVEAVTGDPGADIFDGLAFASGLLGRPKYVPAEQVGRIEEGVVRLELDETAVAALGEYGGPLDSSGRR